MVRKVLLVVIGGAGAVLLLLGVGTYALGSIPHPDHTYVECSFTSPQGTYVVTMLRHHHALDPDTIVGEVLINRSGAKRTIYWESSLYLSQFQFTACDVSWENDRTVVIYGQTLDVTKDNYDMRG